MIAYHFIFLFSLKFIKIKSMYFINQVQSLDSEQKYSEYQIMYFLSIPFTQEHVKGWDTSDSAFKLRSKVGM